MLEGIENFLESINPFGGFFLYLPDVPVSPRAHLLQYSEAFQDVALDVGRVVLGHKSNVSKLTGS